MKNNRKNVIVVIMVILLILVISIGIIYFIKQNKNIKVNTPQLVEGMIPVKWNGSQWIETTTNDKEWYNYANNQWANVKTQDGSMFVWIPRYAYKITKGYHGEGLNYQKQTVNSLSTKESGIVEIQFLDGTENKTFNGKVIDSSNTNSKTDFVIHPAFKFGNKELMGFWIAKYEASKTDSTDTEQGKEQALQFKENKISVTNSDINSMIYYSRNMERDSIYGWKEQKGKILKTGFIENDNNNFDTHLLKNVEWRSSNIFSTK